MGPMGIGPNIRLDMGSGIGLGNGAMAGHGALTGDGLGDGTGDGHNIFFPDHNFTKFSIVLSSASPSAPAAVTCTTSFLASYSQHIH